MVRNIEKWLRKNTIEFLEIWEEMYNPDFNSPEFEGIKNEAGLNRFILSVKQWVEKTNSKGIMAKAERYGGTFAHKDIAFKFASWEIRGKRVMLDRDLAGLYGTETKRLKEAVKRNIKRFPEDFIFVLSKGE